MATRVTTKVVKKVPPQKDKQGSAIVSMILGIIAALFILLAIVVDVVTYGSDASVVFFGFSIVASLIGFPLGLSARKSSKGRGMAIAGITLTFIPFLLAIFVLISSFFYMVSMYL